MADLSTLTYSSLQTAVGDWLARNDLASNIPDFIFLAENEFNQVLRVRQMETLVTLNALSTSGETPLPSDYLTWRRLTYTATPNQVLEYVQPDILRTVHPDIFQNSVIVPGIPKMFTIERNSIIVRPTDSTVSATSTSTNSNLQLDYYQSIPPLAAQGSTGTNWLLTGFADCYLSGSLTEAYAFQKDWDQAGIWKQRRDSNLERLRTFDQKTRGPSAVRPLMTGIIP